MDVSGVTMNICRAGAALCDFSKRQLKGMLHFEGVVRGRQTVKQGKTRAKRHVEITDELKIVLDRIMARKKSHQLRSTRLIVAIDGTPMTAAMSRRRFDMTREAAGVEKADFQMRDLRAIAGTDKVESSGNIMYQGRPSLYQDRTRRA